MQYKATLKRYGNSVEVELDANDAKDALTKAHKEAEVIFDFKGAGDEPTVAIRQIKEKEE